MLLGAPPTLQLAPAELRARFGLGEVSPLRAEPLALEVWPENWLAVQTFAALTTQWQMGGLGGPIGLRYEAIPVVLRLRGVPRAEWPALFDDLRTMESAALAYFGSQMKARHG